MAASYKRQRLSSINSIDSSNTAANDGATKKKVSLIIIYTSTIFENKSYNLYNIVETCEVLRLDECRW